MIKTPHDPTPPKAKVALIAAVVALAAASTAAPVATNAMKMRHDCCVWTAPVK